MLAVVQATACELLVVILHNPAIACCRQHQGVGSLAISLQKRLSAVLVFLCPEPKSLLQIPCMRRTARTMMSTKGKR